MEKKVKAYLWMLIGLITCMVSVQVGDMPNVHAATYGDFEYYDLGTEIEIEEYNGNDTVLVIPSEIDGKAVTNIKKRAFCGCNSLKSVKIPGSVTSIGAAAFFDCKKLTNIEIPESVTSIGEDAFGNTPWLTNKQKENPLVIVNHIVIDGEKCKDVIIPDGVTSIGDSAFFDCKKLTSVKIPESVTSIGNYAFCDCSNLTCIEIPESVTSIGEDAFVYCERLRLVVFPGSYAETYAKKYHIPYATVGQKTTKLSIQLNNQSVSGTLKARVKKSYPFKAVVTPDNADTKNAKVTWTSSNKKIARVTSKGKVTIKKAGKVTITAKTADGRKATVKLNAAKKAVKVTKLKITGSKTMKVKAKQTLKVKLVPATADNQKVTWKSSNTKVATVNSKGVVTAKKAGKVTITATAKDGSKKKATFKIKVN